MLNIQRIQIFIVALFTIFTAFGMQQVQRIQGELLIHADNEVCFVGRKEQEAYKRMGFKSPSGDTTPAIKVDCFTQIGDEDFNWTEGEVEPAFPPYIPLNAVWGLKAKSEIDLQTKINGHDVAIKLYVRDNFETGKKFSKQIDEGIDKFIKDANVIKYGDPTQEFLLQLSLIRKGLIRTRVQQSDCGKKWISKNIHNSFWGHKSILEEVLNKPKRNKDLDEMLAQNSLSGEQIINVVFPHAASSTHSQSLVHRLINREIGRR